MLTTALLLTLALSTSGMAPEAAPKRGDCIKSSVFAGTCINEERAARSTPPAPPSAKPASRRQAGGVPPACSIAPNSFVPPKSDPVWQGHTDGTVVTYYCGRLDGANGTSIVRQQWVPPGRAPAVAPGVLAQQVLATMGLTAIQIGMVPGEGADRVGVVGMPVWMWVKDPTPTTFGPVTASDSAGGVTVTLDATVTSIDWDMGDGTVVHCDGEAARGTEYVDAYDLQESPTCGHTYSKQGAPYTITATSHWQVDWTGGGEAGTIPLDLVATTTRNIGELQVLTTR